MHGRKNIEIILNTFLLGKMRLDRFYIDANIKTKSIDFKALSIVFSDLSTFILKIKTTNDIRISVRGI